MSNFFFFFLSPSELPTRKTLVLPASKQCQETIHIISLQNNGTITPFNTAKRKNNDIATNKTRQIDQKSPETLNEGVHHEYITHGKL